ncbi:response regulator [Foetidibacter luteolus]|uniref:response regulator n=1 Tax=Foetidibacter luteolus TaxID=2608880 RepID=UPI00129A213C|nr:response regulator [Foetidibacter luteolus]
MLTSKSIFIVDDEPLHLSTSMYHLKRLGYKNIACFSSGEECISNLDLRPDIIFLDYLMNEMNGLDTLKAIKAYHRNCFVVFVSGQDNVEDALEALKNGAVDYIVKGKDQLKLIEAALSSIREFFLTHDKNLEHQHKSFLLKNRWYNGFLSPC